MKKERKWAFFSLLCGSLVTGIVAVMHPDGGAPTLMGRVDLALGSLATSLVIYILISNAYMVAHLAHFVISWTLFLITTVCRKGPR